MGFWGILQEVSLEITSFEPSVDAGTLGPTNFRSPVVTFSGMKQITLYDNAYHQLLIIGLDGVAGLPSGSGK
jgi:hypothetical protein